MQSHKLSLPITLAGLALLALLALLTRVSNPAQAAETQDNYAPLPRDCEGVNPPTATVPACCAFGYVFDGDASAPSNTVVVATSEAGAVFTVTTALGPHNLGTPYFRLDLSAHGVNAGDTITLTTQIGERHRTLVYPDVALGGQQIDLVVPRPGRSEVWTVYLTDTFDSVTALALDGDPATGSTKRPGASGESPARPGTCVPLEPPTPWPPGQVRAGEARCVTAGASGAGQSLWVGSGGQGAARLNLETGAAVNYVRPVTASLYNDVRGLAPDGNGGVWWATAGGGAVHLNPSGPDWEQFKVYNSGILGNYLGGVVLDSEQTPWFAGRAPTQTLVYSFTADNGGVGFGGVGTHYVEDDWTGSCRGVRGDARWTPSRLPPLTGDVDWVVYTPTLPSAGAYRVYVHFPRFYTEFGGQPLQDTANARYQVAHDGGATTITVTQDGAWCQWILLGEFNFTPDAGQRLYLGDYTAGEDPRRAVLVDAVKWVRVSDGLEIVVDDSDGDANFGMRDPAAWTVKVGPWNPDGCRPVGGDADWMYSRYPGYTNDSSWGWWWPNLLYDGRYEVEVNWPRFYTGLPDTSNARYQVHHAGGTTIVTRVQDGNWCTWTSLGAFTLPAGSTAVVYLGNYSGESSQTSVILDAARWTYREGLSQGGVSQFNGATWLTDTTPGDSYALAFDSAGTLWVGAADGLAQQVANGVWVTHSTLPLTQVTTLALDEERGQIWLGDAGGGGLAVYTPTSGLGRAFTPPFTDTAAIAVDTAGVVWVGSAGDGGLAALRPDGGWVTYTAATSNLPGDRILALLPDPDGGVWIGATAAAPGQHSGVARLTMGTSPIATIQSIKPSDPVQTRDDVEFRAGGLDTDENGEAILRYEWTTSLMTVPLGSSARFTVAAATLPAGWHTIGLRVLDNEGTWSAAVETPLRIIPPHSWRFLLYLDGDNDLAPYLERALWQLERAEIPPQVTVLALWDGPGADDTVRYHVQADGVYQDGVNRWHLPEANMGSPQTLQNFIAWARENYPADYTYLAIADHGRGTQGLAWDDSSGQNELLTPLEIREALRLATGDGVEPVQVLHLDACLMGLLEQAYQVAPFADYLIASENLAWSVFGYADYARSVGIATSPEELASNVVLSYSARLTDVEGYPHTIAALDLSGTPAVATAVDELATVLIGALPEARIAIGEAWAATQRFDSRNYYTIDEQDEYVDLIDLTGQLSNAVSDTVILSATAAVRQAVGDDFVLKERHRSGQASIGGTVHDWLLDGAHGIALYFPPDNTVWGYDSYLMHVFRFTEDTAWDEFLLAYLGDAVQPPGGAEEPERPPVPIVGDYQVFLPLIVRAW